MYRSRNIHHVDADFDQEVLDSHRVAYKEYVDVLTLSLIASLEPPKN
ncbi:Unknown protein sequence [Pseudomonas amygdali pv. lachrymans]|nr:Unknown protein sequence [Pseudomonas amygdali pv. lachrymans]